MVSCSKLRVRFLWLVAWSSECFFGNLGQIRWDNSLVIFRYIDLFLQRYAKRHAWRGHQAWYTLARMLHDRHILLIYEKCHIQELLPFVRVRQYGDMRSCKWPLDKYPDKPPPPPPPNKDCITITNSLCFPDFLKNFFKGLIEDRASMLQAFLSTIQEHVVCNPSVTKTQKLHLLNDYTLSQIASLYSKWKGEYDLEDGTVEVRFPSWVQILKFFSFNPLKKKLILL